MLVKGLLFNHWSFRPDINNLQHIFRMLQRKVAYHHKLSSSVFNAFKTDFKYSTENANFIRNKPNKHDIIVFLCFCYILFYFIFVMRQMCPNITLTRVLFCEKKNW